MKSLTTGRVARWSLIGVLPLTALFLLTRASDSDPEILVGTARRPLVAIAGQKQQLPLADFLSTVGGLTVNATPASAPGDIEATTIAVTQTDIGQTSNRPLVNGTNTGSYDTTAGIITSTTYNCTNSATRSAGAFGLNNVCIDASTSGGQFNVALLAEGATTTTVQGASKSLIQTLFALAGGFYVLNDGGSARRAQESVSSNAADRSEFILFRALGTAAAKTVLTINTQVATFNLRGWDGSVYRTAAGLGGNVRQAPGLNDMPMDMSFSTALDGTSSALERLTISSSGHVQINVGQSLTPSVSACGAGAVMSSNSSDTQGSVTEGTVATGCIITFLIPWGATPNCVLKDISGLGISYSVSTTAITVVNIGALSSTKIMWVCFGAS